MSTGDNQEQDTKTDDLGNSVRQANDIPLESKYRMKLIATLYMLNSTPMLLHEIESAYEREWEILKLPGKISGFLLLHIPIILIY